MHFTCIKNCEAGCRETQLVYVATIDGWTETEKREGEPLITAISKNTHPHTHIHTVLLFPLEVLECSHVDTLHYNGGTGRC